MPKKKENIGLLGEKVVQKKLWQRNYRVRNVSNFPVYGKHFDLIVNNKIKIEVKTIKDLPSKGRKYIHLRSENFDVLALVVLTRFNPVVFFADKKMLTLCKAKPVEGDRGLYAISINKEIVEENFVKNPKKLSIL